MKSKYESTRFFLFTHSYSGKTISLFLKKKYRSKKLSIVIKRLSGILNFNFKQLSQFIVFDIKPRFFYKKVPKKLKVYLEIEAELSKIKEEKLDEYSTALEDYQRQLLFPAFERAAGNLLEIIENDKEFDTKLNERINEYGNIYYKVAYKYKLPTIRTVPFLLRLINI